jgi:protocatechuate 3,4-dioxygenase beta subunit
MWNRLSEAAAHDNSLERTVTNKVPQAKRRQTAAQATRRVFVVCVISLASLAVWQPVMGITPVLQAQEEGGPVYADDKDAGGGARDVPWSATIAGKSEPGERLTLTGTVFGADDGEPREGVTVYAYHTDARGYYRNKPWGRPRLRGWARTNSMGKYEFHTIKPGPYPLRSNPAHIHMTIAIPGKTEWWIPELRFAGDPFLDRQETERAAQQGTFASICPLEPQADGALRCVRDIRLPLLFERPVGDLSGANSRRLNVQHRPDYLVWEEK